MHIYNYIVYICVMCVSFRSIIHAFMFEKKTSAVFPSLSFLASHWLANQFVEKFLAQAERCSEILAGAKENPFLGKLGGFFSVFPGWKL